MGVEIERRFLVNVAALPPKSVPGYTLRQGYLATRPVVRVRWEQRAVAPGQDPADAATKGYLTIKGPGTRVRAEYEYEIPAAEAEELLGLCSVQLRKHRYYIHDEGHWSIDVFEDNLTGLWLAEIELPSVDAEFARPAWLGREVTDDPRYTNVALAQAQRVPAPDAP